MKILALETSAGPASCALVEDGRVLASAYINTPLTHSQTLMPMVESMLQNAGLSFSQVERLAVTAGPGSFTGVRIGVAAVKGLAFANDTPCVGVSTLAAIARNMEGLGFDGIVCAAMDARCRQVYTACFEKGERLTPDEAISLDELKNRLISYKKPIFLLGDGAKLCYTAFVDYVPALYLAPEHLRYQNAVGVAAEAAQCETVTAEALQPLYLRLPQAERELRARKGISE
ncbi:MAG: tRNA (adenosine(37)-N6)-threonylcarbamoyltransferase complex dimerization subunit type 1 TsaB [Clostridia bacterium]|nr:tRNA (adenosine(37)-N6)-threonylcarbamoyltransferase complex dimerization subunit type 1 TsaB [Clostridia bacterium]